MGYWDVFYNSGLFVQSLMLLSVLAAFMCPCYVLLRFIQTSREGYLPPNTMFAMRWEGDLMHLTVSKQAHLSRPQVEGLMLELVAQKNGPTDNQ